MKTITTHEAKTHLSRYLAEVESGSQFIIARGKRVVAMLVPLTEDALRPRPKAGEIEGEPFDFDQEALAPMTPEELNDWGL